MKIATIFHTHVAGWVEVVTTYDSDYIEALKIHINVEDRKWVPETKSWQIRANRLEALRRLLLDYDFVISEEQFNTSAGANIFREVFNMIPAEYRSRVYFALAQALHPDHGGTNEQMVELNAAHDEVSRK